MVNPKDVVLAVMTVAKTETKTVTEKGKDVDRKFITLRCPKPSCAVKLVTIKEKSGYMNPFSHLRSCYGKGKTLTQQDDILARMYKDACDKAKASGGGIAQHFQSKGLSDYEKAVYHYTRLIVLRRYPISCVIDPELRAISKFTSVVDKNTMRGVLMSLVQLVEERITAALNGKKGALLFDGWTENGTHYVAMIVSYTDMVPSIVAAKETTQPVTRLVLLAASPMAQMCGDETKELCESENEKGSDEGTDSDDMNETISFNAETHLSFFRDNFEFFGQTFDNWCICLISDNCNTNKKIASDCGKPMVGCYSHKLNLEVTRMISSTPDLKDTLASVHETMSAAKSKLKNKAMLRNLVQLAPVVPNATRWSGNCDMVSRYVEIRPELIAVRRDEKCDLPIDATNVFADKVKKYGAQLKEINCVTKELQKSAISLRDCRSEIHDLAHVIALSADKPHAALYDCKLGQHYVGANSDIMTDPVFESAVIKLQENCPQDMTDDEKQSVECLRLDAADAAGPADAANDAEVLSINERRKKRRKLSALPKRYMDCGFILGSVAEVERVWSIAKHLLGDVRHKMAPMMLEALLFLRFNERFWDEQLVAKAISHARTERAKKRMKELEAEMATFAMDDEAEDE